jgi:hypothetical protein
MKKPRFQFGVRRLFVLTTVVALVMAISVTMFPPPFTQGLLTAYLLLLAVWVVMRSPEVYAELRAWYGRWGEFKRRRQQLEDEIVQQKRNLQDVNSPDESV